MSKLNESNRSALTKERCTLLELLNKSKACKVTAEAQAAGGLRAKDEDVIEPAYYFGTLINSTLSPHLEGLSLNSLTMKFALDWELNPELVSGQLGYRSFENLLASSQFANFVEEEMAKGEILYRPKATEFSEHILRIQADVNLHEEQLKELRKAQHQVQMMKVSNSVEYITGRRRILKILLRMDADKAPVPYHIVQDLYLKHYGVQLNTEEHLRLFGCRKATKNLVKAFYDEIEIMSGVPMRLRLKSSEIQLPDKPGLERAVQKAQNSVSLPRFPTEAARRGEERSFHEQRKEFVERIAKQRPNAVTTHNGTFSDENSNQRGFKVDRIASGDSGLRSEPEISKMGKIGMRLLESDDFHPEYTDDENADSEDSETEVPCGKTKNADLKKEKLHKRSLLNLRTQKSKLVPCVQESKVKGLVDGNSNDLYVTANQRRVLLNCNDKPADEAVFGCDSKVLQASRYAASVISGPVYARAGKSSRGDYDDSRLLVLTSSKDDCRRVDEMCGSLSFCDGFEHHSRSYVNEGIKANRGRNPVLDLDYGPLQRRKLSEMCGLPSVDTQYNNNERIISCLNEATDSESLGELDDPKVVRALQGNGRVQPHFFSNGVQRRKPSSNIRPSVNYCSDFDDEDDGEKNSSISKSARVLARRLEDLVCEKSCIALNQLTEVMSSTTGIYTDPEFNPKFGCISWKKLIRSYCAQTIGIERVYGKEMIVWKR